MKNYIAIAALLAAGTAFANAANPVTEEFEFTSAGQTIQLQNEFDLTKDWTLKFSMSLSPTEAASDWGTEIISSESNSDPYQGIQVYAWGGTKNPANTVIVKADNSDDAYKSTIPEGDLLDTWTQSYWSGETDFTLSYDAETKSLSVLIVLEGNTPFVDVTHPLGANAYASGETLSQLRTGITQAQLDTTTSMFGTDVHHWTLPAGSFTGTVVPEPSAFGLLAGIGALALVASRRRRK